MSKRSQKLSRNHHARNDPCYLCNRTADTWDHVEPKSKNGHGGADNFARACYACNHDKGSDSLLLHLAKRRHRQVYGKKWRKAPSLVALGPRGNIDATYRHELLATREGDRVVQDDGHRPRQRLGAPGGGRAAVPDA